MKDSSLPKVLHAEIAPSALLSRTWYPFICHTLFSTYCSVTRMSSRQSLTAPNLPLHTCSQTTSVSILVYYQLLFLICSEAMKHHSRTMKLSWNWEQWGLLCIDISPSCYLYKRSVLWKLLVPCSVTEIAKFLSAPQSYSALSILS